MYLLLLRLQTPYHSYSYLYHSTAKTKAGDKKNFDIFRQKNKKPSPTKPSAEYVYEMNSAATERYIQLEAPATVDYNVNVGYLKVGDSMQGERINAFSGRGGGRVFFFLLLCVCLVHSA